MKFRFLCLFLIIGVCSRASDSLQITLSSSRLMPGDTLSFDAVYPAWKKVRKNGTLHVWVEDVQHRSMWRMRYPVIAGEAGADLVFPAGMPHELYAISFSLQDDFFSMSGRVMSDYRDQQVKVTIMLEDKEFLSQAISLNAAKEFALRKMLFANRAKVFFSPAKSNRTNDLDVQLEVPLDSAFVPVTEQMYLVGVGNANPAPPAGYRFDRSAFVEDEDGTLKSVEVVGKKKTPAERFEEERVTGMFKSSDAFTFDGLGSDQFLSFINIIDWLRGRVAGLRIQPTGDGVTYNIQWQSGETYLFLNEMQVDVQTMVTIPMQDIAYVKVFRPPFYGAYLGGPGGAIAVYTKDGSQTGGFGPRHNFIVNGYTPELSVLPVK